MEALDVKNVKCAGCVDAIRKGLDELEGIYVKDIDIPTGKLQFDSTGETSLISVKEILNNLGYPVNE